MAESFKPIITESKKMLSLDYSRKELEALASSYQTFYRLINSHLNDFFSCNLSESISEETLLLKSQLESATTTNGYDRSNMTLPTCCFTCDKTFSCCCYCIHNTKTSDKNDKDFSSDGKSKNVNKFLTEKKEHEVITLSEVITKIALDTKSHKVVDFGSGKGYLCQHLTSTYKMEVLGIEMNTVCSNSAEKRVEKMKRADKGGKHETYKRATYTINGSTIEESKLFVKFVHKQFITDTSENKYLLTGLHACGNLTSLSVQLFAKEDAFNSLCVIGCCYNLITEEGFPLSKTLKQKDIKLGKQAKFLACQCPIRWKETDQALNKSLLYRAILEKIFSDKEIKREEIQNIKFRKAGKKADTFMEYMVRVREQYPALNDKLSLKEQNEYHSCYSTQWPLMQEFHWMRMQLAPMVEKLILLDRICFLKEQGFENSYLVRLFDPVISPRCYALISTK